MSAITRRTGTLHSLRFTPLDLLLAVAPALFTVIMILAAVRDHWIPYDFQTSYYPAAQRLLRGGSPYGMAPQTIPEGLAFVYPALSAVVFAPFALLGTNAADDLYMLLCFLLAPAALYAAGVRDWRVYGLAMLWAPVVLGWKGGNVSVPLTFLVALTWRHRDSPLKAGLITAFAISLKPFVWPLALWLLVTRRYRAAAAALISALALNLAAWAIIGFNEISTYLRVSTEITHDLWRSGYSLVALGGQLGLGHGASYALLVTASTAIAATTIYVGFIKRCEREALTLSIALMLVASPLVWSHYFVLLLVPLALARPRAHAIWLLPLALWACPPSYMATGAEVITAWVTAAACLTASFHGASVGRWPAGHRPQKSHPTSLATTG